MKVAVKLFARARDLAGTDCLELDMPEPSHVSDVKLALATRFPNLSPIVPNLLVAVGTNYADDSMPLAVGVEIACFPPVSGG